MEIDPHYCDVIINRWQEFTGKLALREGDNKATQKKIEKMIGCNFNVATQSLVFGQEIIERFAKCTDKEQKQFFYSQHNNSEIEALAQALYFIYTQKH